MKYRELEHLTKSEQERTIKTIEDILDAARALSDEGKLDALTVRALSSKSGYTAKTIYRYFEKFDDVFLSLFLWRRKKAIDEVAQIIQAHDCYKPLIDLISKITQAGIQEWDSKPRVIIKMVIRKFFRNCKEPEKYNILMDVLIAPFIDAQKRDQTNTFRITTENDMRLQIRAIQTAIRNPFFEDDPIAGTDEHRRLVIEMGVRLLCKPAA